MGLHYSFEVVSWNLYMAKKIDDSQIGNFIPNH